MMKKTLLAIAVPLTALGVYLSYDILLSVGNFLFTHSAVFFTVIVAVVIQLVGHVFRSERTRLVINQAAPSSMQFQFGALSVGYLFNILLPFRLGEIVRSLVIAKRLHISFLYTFAAVVIERAIDVLFLGLMVVVGLWALKPNLSSEFFILVLGMMLTAIAVLVAIWLLKNENKYLLRLISAITGMFNISINNKLRFKVWSLIFGLQGFFSHKNLKKRYMLYALLSWICYITSAALIIMVILPFNNFTEIIAVSVSSYVASVSALDGGAYSSYITNLPIQTTSANIDIYGKIMWIVLMLPTVIIGLVALIFYRPGTTETAKSIKTDAYVNKLLRHKDISQDFPTFLESYFTGNNMAKILHKIEVSGQLSLVRFFKGGSDAITILVLTNDRLFVKKIIPLKYRDRLKAQYDWLQEHRKMRYLVEIIDEQDTDDYYAIDLAYDPKNIPLFEYIHHNSLKQSKEILDKTWRALYEHLHAKAKPLRLQSKHRDAYIDKHIIGCMNQAVDASDVLRKASKPKKLTINGETYDNLYAVLEKIRKNKRAWRDLAMYQESGAVHGDPSIDNILVSSTNGRPLIIDPAPDGNIINGPVFDMGKWMQSFYCGYEFLFRDDDTVELGKSNSVNYREYRTYQYVRLDRYIRKELAPKYLSDEEQRALLFHGGALLIRRLKHQVHYNPGNALKLYAVGVKTLNDFLAQYD